MTRLTSADQLGALDFTKSAGLVTVVAQDAQTGRVLMVAHADREALERTLATGDMHYHSRTRGLWRKGETSGHVQRVVRLDHDCDADAVLATVIQQGPACHTGTATCFGDDAPAWHAASALGRLDATIAERAASAPGDKPSYTQRLLADRNLRLKKIGEEAAELVLACADEDRERAVSEAADLLYHALTAVHAVGAGLPEISAELERRAR